MAKPRKHTFDATNEKVYEAISKMLVQNAALIDDKYSDCTDISTIKYSYGEDPKIKVKVTEVIENELIKYHTSMEKRERYDVEFKLVPNGNQTVLEYLITIDTDIKKIEMNYNFMKYLYTWKQKKSFKKMCVYLDSVISEM